MESMGSARRVPYYHNQTIFSGKCEQRISSEKVSLSVGGATTRYDRSRYKIKSLPVKDFGRRFMFHPTMRALALTRCSTTLLLCSFEFISIALAKRCQSTVSTERLAYCMCSKRGTHLFISFMPSLALYSLHSNTSYYLQHRMKFSVRKMNSA